MENLWIIAHDEHGKPWRVQLDTSIILGGESIWDKPLKRYEWKIYSNYGEVEAHDIKEAISRAIDRYYGDKDDGMFWADMIVREIKSEFYEPINKL